MHIFSFLHHICEWNSSYYFIIYPSPTYNVVIYILLSSMQNLSQYLAWLIQMLWRWEKNVQLQFSSRYFSCLLFISLTPDTIRIHCMILCLFMVLTSLSVSKLAYCTFFVYPSNSMCVFPFSPVIILLATKLLLCITRCLWF